MPDLARSARPQRLLQGLAAIACALMTVGCASWFGVEPAYENNFVTHYRRLAENVATLDPTIDADIPAPSLGAGHDLVHPRADERWSISLAEAIRMGIENSKVIRQNAQFMSPNNPLLQNPDGVPSVFDPDIQNTGVLFGTRGTSAALSDFDPRLTVSSKWANDQTAQNAIPPAIVPPNNILENNTTQFQARLEQQLLTGGVVALNNNWNYSLSNQPEQLFNSSYTGSLGLEYRQPLWAGAGRLYTAVAGPTQQRVRGFSNVSQGVVVAIINHKLSEIDLQENLQNLVREIGELYWDLYQNYQDAEFERSNVESATELLTAMRNRTYSETGVDLYQSEDAYYEAKIREGQALATLYATEAKLRRMLGLTLDDSRILYPSDPPREDELKFNRAMCLYEALCNRLELTRLKNQLHSYQLQLEVARKLVAPKLDFVGGYALNGFGKNFITSNSDNFNSAASNLFSGKETSWSAGFEYSIPLWLRQEKSQVNQLELKVIKARVALASQESEMAYELDASLKTIQRAMYQVQESRKRVIAATKRVESARAAWELGAKNSDMFWRSLASQTQARSNYTRYLNEYNKGLRDLLYRTGRILPSDGVTIMGIDGLPLMSPSQPDLPFDGLRNPANPTPLVPEVPESDDEKEPGYVPPPKPRPRTPVADGTDGVYSAAGEFERPKVLEDEEFEQVIEDSSTVLPVNFVEEVPQSDTEFRSPIVSESEEAFDE